MPQQTPQPAPTAEDAKVYFAREVTYPVFLQKLAEEFPQFSPRNEHQAEQLVRIGSRLLHAHVLQQEKQASEGIDFLEQAEVGLDRVMEAYYQQMPQQELWLKKTAQALAGDSVVQEAARLIENELQAA